VLLEGDAAFVEGERLLERLAALLETGDDGLEFGEGGIEAEAGDGGRLRAAVHSGRR